MGDVTPGARPSSDDLNEGDTVGLSKQSSVPEPDRVAQSGCAYVPTCRCVEGFCAASNYASRSTGVQELAEVERLREALQRVAGASSLNYATRIAALALQGVEDFDAVS